MLCERCGNKLIRRTASGKLCLACEEYGIAAATVKKAQAALRGRILFAGHIREVPEWRKP